MGASYNMHWHTIADDKYDIYPKFDTCNIVGPSTDWCTVVIQRQRCRPNIRPTTTKANLPTTTKVVFSNFCFRFSESGSCWKSTFGRKYIRLFVNYSRDKKGENILSFNLKLRCHFWLEMTFFDLSVLSMSAEYSAIIFCQIFVVGRHTKIRFRWIPPAIIKRKCQNCSMHSKVTSLPKTLQPL
jgi:hypothetical protein